MTTKNRPDRQWYARMIDETLDDDFVIGPAPFTAGAKQDETPLTVAFGTLVRLARRSKRLSVEQLAQNIAVDAEEVRKIEAEPTYQARPRTISNIARFFDLPVTEVMKLAGAAVSNDDIFRSKALKFAAHSEDMSVLTDDEHELLRSFIRFLREKS